MSRSSEHLEHARRLVEPPGVTQSSIETVSDEGAAPSAVVRQSRTAAAIGILITVVERLAHECDDQTAWLVDEVRALRWVLGWLVAVVAALAAGVLVLYLAAIFAAVGRI
jgi:hypothetical protein